MKKSKLLKQNLNNDILTTSGICTSTATHAYIVGPDSGFSYMATTYMYLGSSWMYFDSTELYYSQFVNNTAEIGKWYMMNNDGLLELDEATHDWIASAVQG